MFLSQILEEYNDSDRQEQVLGNFLQRLWSSKFRFSKYKKYYKYKVNGDLLGNRQDLINLFEQYNEIEYTVCKSFYGDQKLNSIDYIRIHINNMYGYLIDKDVYYTKRFYNLLLTPKKEYFRVIKFIKNNGSLEDVNYQEIKNNIEKAFQEANLLKEQSINKKNNISFNNYKILINGFIKKIFNNYISIEKYEQKHGWELNVSVDGWHEDNYVVKYFCKSLTGYMRNYIRDSKIKPKVCLVCEKNIPNKNTYCNDCYKNIKKINRKKYNKKYYNKIKNT